MREPFAGRRLLGLFPHPDDEAYAAGGTLALAARGGATVRIVSATRGEAGNDLGGVAAAGAAIADLRTRELEASCRVLGAERPHFLGLADGAIASADFEPTRDRVAELADRFRPDVVLTLGRDGVYASADHIAWTEIVTAALTHLGPYGPRLLHAAFPRNLFLPVWRSLRRRAGPAVTLPLPPEGLGADEDQADLRVDIGAVRGRKVAAVAAHRSQLPPGGDPFSFLRPGVLAGLVDFELFTLAGGSPLPSGASDPFAGL